MDQILHHIVLWLDEIDLKLVEVLHSFQLLNPCLQAPQKRLKFPQIFLPMLFEICHAIFEYFDYLLLLIIEVIPHLHHLTFQNGYFLVQ